VRGLPFGCQQPPPFTFELLNRAAAPIATIGEVQAWPLLRTGRPQCLLSAGHHRLEQVARVRNRLAARRSGLQFGVCLSHDVAGEKRGLALIGGELHFRVVAGR